MSWRMFSLRLPIFLTGRVMTMSDPKTVWTYLKEAGMTDAGAAGMMGNMQAESGIISNRVEVLLLNRLAERGIYYSDKSYTEAVDSGKIGRAEFLNPLPGKQYGYGLCQWTSPSRKAGLYDLCKGKGVSIGDLRTQLGFLIQELSSNYQSVWKVLISTQDVKTASDTVLLKFEIPADTGNGIREKRYGYSMKFYNEFHGKTDGLAEKIEKYVSFMEGVAADQSHGYSQANRWGSPDYDCSSLTITALEQAGIPAKSAGATYTGNLAGVLQGLGFQDMKNTVNLSTCAGMARGDILMYHKSGNIGHVAVYVGDGKIVHARGQSYGSSSPGDQGSEIAVTAYNNPGWQYAFRYNPDGVKTPQDADNSNNYSFTCKQVQNGNTGASVRLLQVLLKGLGYVGADKKALTIDGEAGANTIYAVKALQKAKNLSVDGVCGLQTWKALLGL